MVFPQDIIDDYATATDMAAKALCARCKGTSVIQLIQMSLNKPKMQNTPQNIRHKPKILNRRTTITSKLKHFMNNVKIEFTFATSLKL